MAKDSTRIVVSSPMSFSGSKHRLQNLMPGRKAWLAWLTGLVPIAWLIIMVWYVCFGLLLVPWRLVRRGGRKRKLADARHREMLAAMQARR